MSKATGLVLIVVGICVAAYVMPGSEEAAVEQAQETLIVKTAPTVASSTVAPTDAIVPPAPKPAVRPVKADAKPAPADATKPAVVMLTQRVEAPKPTPAYKPPQKVAAAILPGDKVGLTRELQRELKRVGCYDGDVNGVWTPASRRAMKAFTDRVNATLPIDEPDYILLTLVQGRQERACGAPCPAGQGMAEDGRCLPSAVMAQAAKKTLVAPPATKGATAVTPPAATTPGTATSGWTTTLTAVAPKMPVVPEGRMALAGPAKEPAGVVPTAKPLTVYERPTKPRTVEKPARRYVASSRQKFGPSFFRQQYGWNY